MVNRACTHSDSPGGRTREKCDAYDCLFTVLYWFLIVLFLLSYIFRELGKKFSYRSGTARRAMSVETLSSAAQLYEKLHLKKRATGE